MIYEAVTELAKKAPIKQVCQALDISRSGYYAARCRANTPKPICLDSVHAQAVFLASGRTYGSRRLSAALRAQVCTFRGAFCGPLARRMACWKSAGMSDSCLADWKSSAPHSGASSSVCVGFWVVCS